MQYLERSSLAKTLETFEAEAADLGLPIQDEADTAKDAVEGTATVANSAAAPIVSVSDADHLLGMFDNVYEDAFFKMWEDPEAVPHVHDTATYAKLNFRLHLYFCCRKISDGLASPAECLQNIKEFLDREGTALSHEQEFIPYFALPFVQDPAEHPTFKGLFQGSSWRRLRGDLSDYLHELRQGDQLGSRLVQMVLTSGGSAAREAADFYLQVIARDADAKKVRKKYAQLVHGHQALRRDYQKLILVMKELTAGLESVTKASVVNSPGESSSGRGEVALLWEDIMRRCSAIYPELFAPEDGLSGSPEKQLSPSSATPTVSSAPVLLNQDATAMSKTTSDIPTVGPVKVLIGGREGNLDLTKIRADLVDSSLYQRQENARRVISRRRKLVLFQALRWLLTQTENGQRSMILDAFVDVDILGLGLTRGEAEATLAAASTRMVVLGCLLANPEYSELRPAASEQQDWSEQTSVARLVNAMASMRRGRSYLGKYVLR